MHRLVEKYEKNPRLTNLQFLEIRKIVSKVTRCADSWRNTEKSEFSKLRNFRNLQDNFTIPEKSKLATRDTFATHSRMRSYKQLTICREIRKIGQFFLGFVGNLLFQRCFNC